MTALESTKVCTKCKRTLPLSEFYRRAASKDGLTCQCKECRKAAEHEWTQKKRAECDTSWLENNRERCRKRTRKWRGSVNGKISRSKYRTANKAKLNEQHRVHVLVARAVQHSILPSIETRKCERCSEQAYHYHHHLGYAKEHQLDVQPLCRICHKAAHIETKRIDSVTKHSRRKTC